MTDKDLVAEQADLESVDQVQTGESADTDAAANSPVDEVGELSPTDIEGDLAADYLEGFLDIADLDGDIDTYSAAGRAYVSIITESDILVGKDGEVLDALQELSRLAVMNETGNRCRMMLDIADFRKNRKIELQALAEDACAEVSATKEPVRLDPMNSFERKVVHDVVTKNGLVSESEGEEPQRRVVISAG